jgi:hypothetical protein
MAITLQEIEKLADQLKAEEKLRLIEHLAHDLAKEDKSAPAYYHKGRPVYTKEQLAQMDNPLPNEAEWVAEVEKRAGNQK